MTVSSPTVRLPLILLLRGHGGIRTQSPSLQVRCIPSYATGPYKAD